MKNGSLTDLFVRAPDELIQEIQVMTNLLRQKMNRLIIKPVILPKVGIYGSGAETQPDSKNAKVNIKNETHGWIIYNIPEALEGTPAESRAHDTQAISEVLERVLAPPESVKILPTFRLRNTKRPTAYSDTPCPIKVILSSATERDFGNQQNIAVI